MGRFDLSQAGHGQPTTGHSRRPAHPAGRIAADARLRRNHDHPAKIGSKSPTWQTEVPQADIVQLGLQTCQRPRSDQSLENPDGALCFCVCQGLDAPPHMSLSG